MMVRRLLLFAVVLGVMSVSIHGQVSVTEPLLGFRFAVTLAVVLDVGALLALNEVLTTRRADVRRWGWTALLLAAGLSVGLNVWHAVDSGTLPLVAAVAVGAIPVVLAGVLSHLLALSLAAETEAVPTPPVVGASRVGTDTWHAMPRPVPTATGTENVARVASNSAGTSPAGTSKRADAVVPRDVRQPASVRAGSPGGTRSGGQRSARQESTARSSGPRPTRQGTGASADGLPPAAAALWEQARELDIRYRREHGGEGVSRRRLMAEYGIGTSTAAPLLRALVAAAEAAESERGGIGGTESATVTGTGAASATGTGARGTGTDVSTGAVGTTPGTDPEAAPPVGTDTEPAPRLALVSRTGTEPARPGTGVNSDQDDTDATAATAGR